MIKRMPENITENIHEQVMTLPSLPSCYLPLAVLSVFAFDSFLWKAAKAKRDPTVSAL